MPTMWKVQGLDDTCNRNLGVKGVRFPSNNTIEYTLPFKVAEYVRGYIRAALEEVTKWYNEGIEETHPGAHPLTIAAAVEMDNYGHIVRTLERVWYKCSMQFTVPHKTRALKAWEILARLAAVGAQPMRINLGYKWEVMESP